MAFVTVHWNEKTKVYRMLIGDYVARFSVDKEDCATPAKILNVLLESKIKEEVADALESERKFFCAMVESLLGVPVRAVLAKLTSRMLPLPVNALPGKASAPTSQQEDDNDDE